MERGIDIQKPNALDSRLCVIAEIGSCHEGSFETALRLIDAAAAAGAHVVKAQYWSSGARLAQRRNAPELREAYETFPVPREWLGKLAAACEAAGVEFACTSYLPEDVWAVAEHCRIMKVASFESNDPELLTCHREPLRLGKHVVVSLGMNGSVETMRRNLMNGLDDPDSASRVRVLHCVSAYPAPVEELNLGRISDDGFFRRMHGFSDHAPSDVTFTGAWAVAAGARILERHMRLDSTPESNPDFPHSMAPAAFKSYVEQATLASKAMSPWDRAGVSDGMPCEQAMLRYRVRK